MPIRLCEAVRSYCIINNLFTCGTNTQYERMFDLLKNWFPLHDIATIIWVCSDTDKHAADIEADLIALAEDHTIPDRKEGSI